MQNYNALIFVWVAYANRDTHFSPDLTTFFFCFTRYFNWVFRCHCIASTHLLFVIFINALGSLFIICLLNFCVVSALAVALVMAVAVLVVVDNWFEFRFFFWNSLRSFHSNFAFRIRTQQSLQFVATFACAQSTHKSFSLTWMIVLTYATLFSRQRTSLSLSIFQFISGKYASVTRQCEFYTRIFFSTCHSILKVIKKCLLFTFFPFNATQRFFFSTLYCLLFTSA